MLIVGAQTQDYVHQAPLVGRLAAKFGARLWWLAPDSKKDLGSTTEEAALMRKAEGEFTFVESRAICNGKRLSWKISKLAAHTDARILAHRMEKLGNSSLNLVDWHELLLPTCLDLHSAYARITAFLDQVDPKVVVCFSLLGDVASFRQWAKARGVPTILFPHGAYFTMAGAATRAAEYVAVLGSAMKKDIDNRHDKYHPRESRIVGSLYFGSKLKQSPHSEAKQPATTVILCTAWDTMPLMNCSPETTYQQFKSIALACQATGLTLCIREHPRAETPSLAPLIEYLQQQYPGLPVRLSKAKSLFDDFAGAVCAVFLDPSGTVVDALLQELPVVVYAPNPSQDPHAELLLQHAPICGTQDSLKELLEGLQGKRPLPIDFWRKQKELRVACMADVAGDEWEPAVQFVSDVFERTRMGQLVSAGPLEIS